MRSLSSVASVLLTLVLAGCDSAATTRLEEAARVAAERWLAQADGGDHAGAWEVAAPVFKVSIRKKDWEDRAATFYRQLGKPDRRELVAAKHTTSVPGLGRGEYVVIQYRRPVRSARPVLETLVMQRAGEEWRAAMYNILPSTQ